MVNSRNKGANFERKICNDLHDLLGNHWQFKRDIEQYRAADHGDIITSDPAWPFVIECKRYAQGTACQPVWMEQARSAATVAKKFPVVVYQYDRRAVRVAIELRTIAYALGRPEYDATDILETDMDGFASIAREILAVNAEKKSIELMMDGPNGI